MANAPLTKETLEAAISILEADVSVVGLVWGPGYWLTLDPWTHEYAVADRRKRRRMLRVRGRQAGEAGR